MRHSRDRSSPRSTVIGGALLLTLTLLMSVLPGPAARAGGTSTDLGTNGQHRRPFWNYGHNPNTMGEVDADLAAGANALEPDMMHFSDSAICTDGGGTHFVNSTFAGTSGLFVYHDSTLTPTRCPDTVEAWLDHVHTKVLNGANVAAIAFDIKSPAANSSDAVKLQTAVHTHLNYGGVMVNIFYSVGDFPDAGAFDVIGTQLTANEGIMIDGTNDPVSVYNTLAGKGASRIGYGNGSAGECYGLAPNVLPSMDLASWIRAGQPFYLGIPYAFPICSGPRMTEYMKTVDGLIPDCDTIIGCGTTEILVLRDLIAASPDVYLATAADNPFIQGKESYGLRVHTSNHTIAGGAHSPTGTDDNLTFTLTGTCGSASVTLDASYQKRFEWDDVNYVTLPSKSLGHLTGLTLSSNGTDDWDPDTVKISSDRYGIPYASDITVTLNYNDPSINSSHPRATDISALNVGDPKCDTTTTITNAAALASTPTVTGQTVTVTYSVGKGSAPGTPTGTVTVGDDQGRTLCSGTVAAGQCSGAMPAAGARTFTATYGGDGGFNSSFGAGAPHTVNKADVTVTLTSHLPSPSIVNQPVVMQFTIAATPPGAVVAPTTITGTVTVGDGTTSCVVALPTLTCTVTFTTTGARTLTASYAGDVNFNAGVSPGVAHTVLTPQQAAGALKAAIDSSGAASAPKLDTYLNSAFAYLGYGTPTMKAAACQQLKLFKTAVTAAMVNDPVVPAQGPGWIAYADAIRAGIPCVAPN